MEIVISSSSVCRMLLLSRQLLGLCASQMGDDFMYPEFKTLYLKLYMGRKDAIITLQLLLYCWEELHDENVLLSSNKVSAYEGY